MSRIPFASGHLAPATTREQAEKRAQVARRLHEERPWDHGSEVEMVLAERALERFTSRHGNGEGQ